PPALRGKDIELVIGKVDDVDETFVNGVKVGQSGSLPPDYATAYELTRRYVVPAKLLKGDGADVIAIRDYNGDGVGGLYVPKASAAQDSGPFSSDAAGGAAQGFTSGGVGWYRKTFTLPASLKGRLLSVHFDGAYMDSQVWLNGQKVGTHAYGYTPFTVNLTPTARLGGRNVLAVRLDASGRTSRWYSGAGLYRHVWLDATAPVHIAENGVFVTTPQVSATEAAVNVHTQLVGIGEGRGVVLTSRIVDAQGKTVDTAPAEGPFATATGALDQPLTIPHPRLWSPDTPTLYRLISTLSVNGKVIDETQTPFGIRTISFDGEHGFRLNGVTINMRGGCVHHDNGPMGSAAFDRAEERRVELLKAAGFNAIRTSHNPPSPAFLDACDRLGMVVIDEAFDCWANGKNPQDYGRFFEANWKGDIDAMVQRDRNHPCVVLWSIGNEIPEQNSPEGAPRAAMLAAEVRAQDPTRDVTQATNPSADKLDPLLAHLDVAGYNYQAGRFAADHAKHPERVFIQTESFPKDCFNSWMQTADHSYVVGDFVWTALDYIGEAGIGRVMYPGDSTGFAGDYPWTVSGCGDIDLIGTRKPQSYYRGVVWGVGPKVTAFVDAVPEGGSPYSISGWGWRDERASWTWPGTEGKNRTVRVYANTPQVRLLLNGRDLGVKDTNRDTQDAATYTVPYAPGELTAVGLDAAGQEIERWMLRTAGPPATLRLTPDRTTIHADGQDLSYVTVEVRDAHGVLCPNAADLVHFTLSGPGQIAAVGNGNTQSVESFQQPQRHAFQGRCLVILQSDKRAGTLRLTVSAHGLPTATATVRTIPSPPSSDTRAASEQLFRLSRVTIE
ncbi:MAG: DUF4982 domain-containing protein, partial [Armatimonadota bacterium]|nr:DUF4982 domain-containing protein [Armatimonadota bacterium]